MMVPLHFHDYSQQVVAGTVSKYFFHIPFFGEMIQFDYSNTVDGQNPAPVDR